MRSFALGMSDIAAALILARLTRLDQLNPPLNS